VFDGCSWCFAAPQTNVVRRLTVQECVRLALANNFDVQIESFNPRIAEFDYERLRGVAYDPVFSTAIQRSYNSRAGGLNQQTGQPFASTMTENTTFAPGISGGLPTGLTYNLAQNVGHRTGFSGKDFDFYDSTTSATLTQPLLRNAWIDINRQNIWVAKKEIKISEEAYRQQLIDVAT